MYLAGQLLISVTDWNKGAQAAGQASSERQMCIF